MMPNLVVTPAAEADLPAVVALVNSAYRGEGAQAGWTTEAAYIDGQRTSLEDLKAELAGEPRPILLVMRPKAQSDIIACAMVEPHIEQGYAYLGMITVRPGLQAGGVGRAMLAAAESCARSLGAARAQMTVVHIRDTLIAWYERRGYRLTGERKPFPYDDARFGAPKVAGLEFVVLDKAL
jgi:ribosomal protein S18 acetylase RimI-like enzyme